MNAKQRLVGKSRGIDIQYLLSQLDPDCAK